MNEVLDCKYKNSIYGPFGGWFFFNRRNDELSLDIRFFFAQLLITILTQASYNIVFFCFLCIITL